MRKCLVLVAVAGLAAGLGVSRAGAGLSAADIEALREQGEREGWTFTVGENPATEYSLDQLCGLVPPVALPDYARFDPCYPVGDLPESFDWRALGGCTSVKNQNPAGTCWAFGTVGPLECNILIKDNLEVDLSEQWLVSCNQEGYGTGGGWFVHEYHQWKTDPFGGTGAVFEADFPYTAQNSPCNGPYPHHYWLDDWAYIGGNYDFPSNDAIKQAIVSYGPVSCAVTVNNAFSAYTGGIFNSHSSSSVNHAVVLVGWDDNQGPNGVWFLRNSWGPGWGEGGYMRIVYGISSIGYSAAYVNYAPTTPAIEFAYPSGLPEITDPTQPTTFPVHIVANGGSAVDGTGQLHYSMDGGTFTVAPMTQGLPNQYQATLPATAAFNRYYWYVSAEEASAGRRYDPWNPPVGTYWSISAGTQTVVFEDDFETNTGWTVHSGATTGNWERADPEEVYYATMHYVTQPEDDHTSSGTHCYVTEAAAGSGAGSYDVDGGPTRLTSPVIDLSGVDLAKVSYWRWYHIGTSWDDELTVQVSNNGGGSWVTVETVENRQLWTHAEWIVNDYVPLTSQMQIRFVADDQSPGSLVEALIDDFRVVAYGEGGQLVPPVVSIDEAGGMLTLGWDAVPGAATYEVYSSTNAHAPKETWPEDTSGTLHMENPQNPYWVAPLTGAERFYYVKAVSTVLDPDE
jgi:C1A family cysteine protease